MLIGTDARAVPRRAARGSCRTVRCMLSRRAENGLPASATGGVLSSMSNAPISGVISGVLASRTSCSEIAQARPSVVDQEQLQLGAHACAAFAPKPGRRKTISSARSCSSSRRFEALHDPLR